MDINTVVLAGEITDSKELSYTKTNNKPVLSFSIATMKRYLDGQGSQQSHIQYHRITVWGQLAIDNEFKIHKGRKVKVIGEIQTHSMIDSEGNKKNTTEIIANSIEYE